MNIQLDTRRHADLFNPYTFDKKVIVLGAGASGSWLVLMLAKLGIQDITVYDFDIVEEHNIPNQLYGMYNVGELKVLALKEMVLHQTGTKINAIAERFESQRLSGYVFCMVDTMAGRDKIWKYSAKLKSAISMYTEPRMGLDTARVYNVDPMNLTHHKRYEDCFYSDDEAEVSACGTSMSVITTALTTASWCVRQLIEHNAGREVSNEILIDVMYNGIVETRW
jgi:molybdopterin/thiamine biosynthesis adenylyltransferase